MWCPWGFKISLTQCVKDLASPLGSFFSTPSPAVIICRLFDDGHSDWWQVMLSKQSIRLEFDMTQLFIYIPKYALWINLLFFCVLFNAYIKVPSLNLWNTANTITTNTWYILELHCAKYCFKYFQYIVI